MKQDEGFFASAYRLLGSIKLTVFLLLGLAAGSLVGTLLPQGIADEAVTMHFGSTTARWILFFQLNDLYHSTWFQFLLVLLCANLVVCTLNRFPKTRRLLGHRERSIKPEKLVKFHHHAEWTSPQAVSEVRAALESGLTSLFSRPKVLHSDPDYAAVAEKGRWSHWMIYVVHGSVLLILLGAFLGSVLGYKGYMNIDEGTGSDVVHLFRGQQVVHLPYEVRCDRFQVSFYDNGMPKDYRSDLSIVKGGRTLVKRSIRVNDPLSYQGVTFYQASYGASLKQARLVLTDTGTGRQIKLAAPFQESMVVPGTSKQIQIVEYRDDLRGFGPALAIGLLEKDKAPTGSWILVDHPRFHGNRIGPYRVTVSGLDKVYYTGLQVKKDPGVTIVLLGFVTLLIGLGTTFYTSHRKIWLWTGSGEGSTRIVIAGRANKNSLAFENEFNDLCERLKNQLERDQ